jgi:hypothetical protein
MDNEPTLNDYLATAGNIGVGVAGALNKPKTVVQSGGTNWGIIAGIGAAVVVVLVLVLAVVKK